MAPADVLDRVGVRDGQPFVLRAGGVIRLAMRLTAYCRNGRSGSAQGVDDRLVDAWLDGRYSGLFEGMAQAECRVWVVGCRALRLAGMPRTVNLGNPAVMPRCCALASPSSSRQALLLSGDSAVSLATRTVLLAILNSGPPYAGSGGIVFPRLACGRHAISGVFLRMRPF
ncbi:hypothetical protein ABZ829_11975 [Streptomyces xanthochromogenes]|uniref:hypothetical protein n=1 Tax=Streptomyces xanthochromogenes TaxID=67384 RepID=UPI00341D9544